MAALPLIPLINHIEEEMLNMSVNILLNFLRFPNRRRLRALAVIALCIFLLLRFYGHRLERTPARRQWFERRFLENLQLAGAIHQMAINDLDVV